MLATLTVNSFADTQINTDGVLTLREAVEVVQQGNTNGLDSTTIANQISGIPLGNNDTINFATSLNGATITLDRANLGQISFGKSLTISVDRIALPAGVTVNADDPTPGRTGHGIRVFNITDPSNGTNTPLVTLSGLTLKGGDVGGFPGQGGAIRSEARLVVRDCTITENEADFGGGIYVQVARGATTREVLKIENSLIEDNDAGTGGGVAIVSGDGAAPTTDTIVITAGTTISDNKAIDGGGVYAELYGATMTIADSSLVLNESAQFATAPSGRGGGLYAVLGDEASLQLIGTTVEENDGSFGAGLYVNVFAQSTLRLEDSTVVGNEATADGGGAFVAASNSTVEVVGSFFRQNDATNSGGGLFGHSVGGSTLTIDDTEFELNSAAFGGGLYVDVFAASAEIYESSFVSNDATVSGGGVYAALNDDGAMVEIANSKITLNEALSQNEGGGGGVFGIIASNADATLEIRDSQITGNIAVDGGGVRVDMAGFGHTQANGSEFIIERSRVEGNRAVNRGGGILTTIGAGGKATVSESVITGNDAGIALLGTGQTNRILNAGGGMYAYLWADLTAPTLTIAGSEFSFNKAGQHGGGLALCTKREQGSLTTSQLSVYNTTFSGNQAGHTTAVDPDPGKGGGVYLAMFQSDGQALDARFQNTTITNNIADQGGGVWSYVPLTFPDSQTDVRLTNSIASANKKHNGDASNLYGSFNIPLTRFNIIGAGDTVFTTITTWTHDTPNGEMHEQKPLLNQLEMVSNSPSGNIFTNDPKLTVLTWHGGPTRTHRPRNDSLALDAGSNALAIIPFTTMLLTTDQRGTGFRRSVDLPGVVGRPEGPVDIGAYEIGVPKVIEVNIRQTFPFTHPEYAFSTVVGSGEQLRTVPVGGADSIEVWFSEQVTVTAGAITVQSAHIGPLTGATTTRATMATWQLISGTFTYDQLILRIDDVGVNGLAGRLDGNWDNPDFLGDTGTDTFPSGNNVVDADDDFTFRFTVLTGDFNHDNIVNSADYVIWDKNKTVTSGATHSMGDANGDGAVNSTDWDIWRSQFGLDFRVWPT